MNIAYKHFKIILEPGGAVALAAAIAKKIDVEGKNILVIASGGNVDSDIFKKCLNQKTF
jgi:threonine dehydratase